MEDKRLERGVEEIANRLVSDYQIEIDALIHPEILEERVVEALQRERDKLSDLEAKRVGGNVALLSLIAHGAKRNDELQQENATLQSQITALNRERDSWLGSKDGKIKGEHWEVVEDAAQTIADLQDQLTTIKELLNGASLHGAGTETGVSLVDDVRDLVKELARWKNSVPGSIKSYIAQVEHEKKEVAVLKAENTRLREALDKMMALSNEFAKAALEGTK